MWLLLLAVVAVVGLLLPATIISMMVQASYGTTNDQKCLKCRSVGIKMVWLAVGLLAFWLVVADVTGSLSRQYAHFSDLSRTASQLAVLTPLMVGGSGALLLIVSLGFHYRAVVDERQDALRRDRQAVMGEYGQMPEYADLVLKRTQTEDVLFDFKYLSKVFAHHPDD